MRDPRHTRQRAAIAACFKAAGTFLTIAQAHQAAQRWDESIALSTVYRTVRLLLEEGALDSSHDATRRVRRCFGTATARIHTAS